MRITAQKGFGGIDRRVTLGDDLTTAAKMKNFRVTDGGGLQKRGGFRPVCTFVGEIKGLWSGYLGTTETVIIAASQRLYRVDPGEENSEARLLGEVGDGECMIFEFNGAIYVKTQSFYGKYDGNTLAAVEGYIPCVAIGCGPDGSGEIFEQINLLSDKRRQLFSCDGTSIIYHLAENNAASIVSLRVNGEEYTGNYSLESGRGVISFEIPPSEGLNNMEVVYSVSTPESDRNRIMKCTRIMLFGGNSDGRAFLWGNPDFPNYRFHSELADGIPSVEYFPANGFTVIGNSKINCIVQQYDRQLIFTKNEAYYSFSELRDDGLGNTVSSFPVYSLNSSKGCMIETDGCVIDNRPVTLCDDGLNRWESTAVENEKNALCFSSPIGDLMAEILASRTETVFLQDFQFNRELYFICGDIAYIYNYGNGSWYSHSGFRGSCYSVCGSVMYIGKDNRIYAFGYGIGDNSEIECRWESPFITFGQSNGRCDITSLEADITSNGEIYLTFTFEKSNGEVKNISYGLHSDFDCHRRISLRPAIKRTMPVRLTVTQSGTGTCTLHRMSITTNEKERSDKNGIL